MTTPLAIGQGSFTRWFQNAKLDFFFGLEIPSALCPFKFYAGLSLLPADPVTGNYAEPSGPAYHRAAILNDTDHWTKAVDCHKANAKPIVWPMPLYGWGRVLSVFLADEPKGGNVYIVANLVTPVVVDTYYLRDVAVGPSFAPGALFIQDA
jgi:hypothetical protein